ncbi:hypothetical protein EMA8858_04036 [Emticicia aquatica]|uniref:Uncharacterized protein n=1 Tax=Emticicia aquatica TaxID=1681835 RepID=A0ABN8EYX1_9BACT|nr:hypothetical protein [Emticicia aquatica]CAH0997901.1 hypothetical protein EMA8858_04036 [Emticicia aquatica]
MKTEKKLNADILKITMTIQENFPELSKYIVEMPISAPDIATPQINIKILEEYHDSLATLLKDYAVNHGNTTKKP